MNPARITSPDYNLLSLEESVSEIELSAGTAGKKVVSKAGFPPWNWLGSIRERRWIKLIVLHKLIQVISYCLILMFRKAGLSSNSGES